MILEGQLSIITRARSSTAGTPRYWCSVGGVPVWTGIDSAVAYEIPARVSRPVRAQVRTVQGRLTLSALEPQ
jgi:hypothetical protein